MGCKGLRWILSNDLNCVNVANKINVHRTQELKKFNFHYFFKKLDYFSYL